MYSTMKSFLIFVYEMRGTAIVIFGLMEFTFTLRSNCATQNLMKVFARCSTIYAYLWNETHGEVIPAVEHSSSLIITVHVIRFSQSISMPGDKCIKEIQYSGISEAKL